MKDLTEVYVTVELRKTCEVTGNETEERVRRVGKGGFSSEEVEELVKMIEAVVKY